MCGQNYPHQDHPHPPAQGMAPTTDVAACLLNVNVLSEVMSYLDLVERFRSGAVARSFRTVAEMWVGVREVTPSLLRTVGPAPTPCTVSTLSSLFRSGRPLTRVILTKVVWEDPATVTRLLLSMLKSSRSTLEELSLSNMRIPEDFLKASRCVDMAAPRLATLRLVNCPSSPPLAEILQLCTNITTLDLRGCDENVVLPALLQHTPAHLRSLSIGWAAELADLVRSGPDFAFYESHEVNAVLRQITAACSGTLEHLAVPGFVWVNRESLTSLGKCMGLLSVNLSNCRCVNDSAALEMLRENVMLEEVNLRATSVGDSAIRALSRCANLRVLNVSCSRISDAALQTLALGCPNITKLDLCYPSKRISPSAVLEAVRVFGGNLKLLGLGGHTDVTDDILGDIMIACCNIQTLGIGSCSGLTSAVWSSIAKHLVDIRHIMAHGLNIVTYDGIMEIATERRSLTMVDLMKVPVGEKLTQEQKCEIERDFPMDWALFS